jgi:PPP family 3-phenylpropionic acid transporter
MLSNPLRRVKYGLLSLPGVFYRFGAMGFFFWAAMAATSFSTVYLQELGFTALEIGTMGAAFTVINIVAPPLWGVVSDKLHSVKKVFAICVGASAVVWLLLPYSVRWISPLIVILMLPLYRLFGSPTIALLDSWIVQQVSRGRGGADRGGGGIKNNGNGDGSNGVGGVNGGGGGGIGFGAIRLWGSVGFAIVAFAYGILLRDAPLDIIFFGYALFSIPCIALALNTKEVGSATRRPVPLREMQIGRIFRTAPLVAYMVFNLLIYTPIMASFTFLPYLVQEVGEQGAFIGMIMCAEALLEIPLLFFSSRLLKRFRTTNLILFCACLYTLEMTLYSVAQASWQILLFKCLHGLGFGLYLGSVVQYVHRLAPKGLAATVQTLCGVSSAIAGIFGNLIGGAIINAYGIRVFFRYSGVTIFLTVIAYFLWLRKHKEAEPPADADDQNDAYEESFDNSEYETST